MGCSEKYSIAITILLVSIVVKSFGELIVVWHPLTDEGDTVKATCIAEEVDAALIWNYDNTTGNVSTINNFTSFQPVEPNSRNTNGCEIGTQDSGSCFVEWEQVFRSRGWKEVNSKERPMSPVHDYRWEGFREFTFVDREVQYLDEQYFKTVVFSARGSQTIKIAVCGHFTVAASPCGWIMIVSKSNEEESQILSCSEGEEPDDNPTRNENCERISTGKPDRKERLETYKWHTFRIEFGVGKNLVQVYADVDVVPFLQGTIGTRASYPYYLIITDYAGTRVRLHEYSYLEAESDSANISTEAFQSGKEELCFELIVGLCSECGMKVHLVDESRKAIIDTVTIFGNDESTTSGPLTWQSRSVRLSIKKQRDNRLSLKIQTVLNDTKRGEGHWAIDKVRSCQPRGTMRASTITVLKPKTATNKYRPRVVCQKLSHRGSDTIDLSGNFTRDLNTSYYAQMLKAWRESCGSSCEGFGKGSLICNSKECGCDRGFQGGNCTEECTLGSYGYNCNMKCGSCKDKKCNKETGHCEDGCESVGFEPPFCQRVKPPLDEQNLSWLVVFAILGIILLLLYIWYRKRTKAPAISRQPSYLEIIPLSPSVSRRNNLPALVGQTLELIPLPSTIVSGNSSAAPVAPTNLVLQPNAKKRRTSAYLYSIPNDPDSWRVPVENFEEYVKNAVTGAQLNSQFKLLPKGSTKPSVYGRLLGNIRKNRSANVIAYDDTRVILRKIPGDPYSDYINANYIRGFGKERAYIATQGSMSNTVEDFWRMVWQEDVRIVCMLTNVIEDGEDKCVQYWPDIGAKVKYGDIVILNADHQVFADFTFRSFKLRYQQQTRKVAHLHYTGWPSYGIPTYPQSLAMYLKKLLKLDAGDGPVVVHCDTGDDRTGTIILCDICLREVVQTKAIDVTGVTTRLRESRANMVGTLQQFLLAHIMIVEVLMVLPTQVPCDDILPKRMRQLRNRLLYDIERLNETMWQQQTLKLLAEPKPLEIADEADNEFPGTGTPEVVYANLRLTFESRISLIGAVSVDGVKMKRQHLASHLPPPFKLSDFWGFVTENHVTLIIILQCSDPGNPSCSDIMPDESIVLQMPDIEFVAETNSQNDDEDEYFNSEKLTLVETSQESAEPQSVTVLTCRGWARGSNGKPPEPVALVSLWTASERVLREEGQTLVLCHDGVTACGLYLAMSFLLERMAVERECDVISAIRAVRRSRPEFVQSVEQCEYLYDAAEKYAEYFESYANFT